jgi:hypothetical protein
MSLDFRCERSKIVNLAVELDYWRGTAGNMDEDRFIAQFPSIKKLIIATGDLGERASYNDDGDWAAVCKQNGRITPCYRIPTPRHLEPHLGDISFNPDCVQIDFRPERYNGYSSFFPSAHCEVLRGLEFKTMAVKRGGIYWGHPSRLKINADDMKRLTFHNSDDLHCWKRSGWSRDLEALIDL